MVSSGQIAFAETCGFDRKLAQCMAVSSFKRLSYKVVDRCI